MTSVKRQQRPGASSRADGRTPVYVSSQFCIILSLLLTVVAEARSNAAKGQMKSVTDERIPARAKSPPEAVPANSCHQVLKKCKHNKKCREALDNLKGRCAVKSGSCNAKMRDLPVCADIMDTLTRDFLDLDNKCTCKQNTRRCKLIHQRIYDNPCFVSIAYLRKMDMLPRLDAMSEPKNPTRVTAKQHKQTSELFDLFLRHEDYSSVDEEAVTIALVTSTSTTLAPRSRSSVPSIQKSVTEKRKPSEDTTLGRTNEKPASNPFDLRQDDNTLLHVVAISTGILVLLMLAVGTAVVIYISVKRKENNNEKVVTMT